MSRSSIRDIGKTRYDGMIVEMTATSDPDERLLEVFKALSNPNRLRILGWLKQPEENFPPSGPGAPGVCLKHIQAKAEVSQSTASQFMATLQRAGLVRSHRVGPWTHYERDEQRIEQLAREIGAVL